MSEPSKAVFLSYASQDAEAAKRICDALRAAGVEVWFDQSELRGGDAWDAMIRKRIKECALFVPLITPATNARAEGYFRLEWKLAVDRSHLMADDAPFLFPIVIGDVTDATARVPDKFRDVQWTRLRLDETPAELGARVAKLLGGESRVEPSAGRTGQRPARTSRWMRNLGMAVGLLIGLIYALRPLWAPARRPGPKPAAVAPAVPAAPAPVSEARQLALRAQAMTTYKYDSTADDYAAAEGLVKRALELDPGDGEIWAISSVLNRSFQTRGFDRSPARFAAARSQAERAIKLAPDSVEARYAMGFWQRSTDPAAAEQSFKAVLARSPDHAGALFGLSNLYNRQERVEESLALLQKVAAQPAYAALAHYLEYLTYFSRARFADADRAVRLSLAVQPSANSQAGLAMTLLTWRGDADGAARTLLDGPSALRNEPRTVWTTAQAQLCRRAADEALQALDRLADDYIQDSWFTGPKAYFVGRAHALAGRPEAARVAWEAGLALVEARLRAAPENRDLHLMHGELLALLGQADAALREARTVTELDRGQRQPWFVSPVKIYAGLGRVDDALPLLEKLCPPQTGDDVGWPLTPALLRLDPLWDKLRGDPRFQKLVGDSSSAKAPADWSGPASPPDQKSVAVLAFADLSEKHDSEYFSDGISEELLNVLAKVPGLKVSARTSAFYFKGKEVPVPEIARQLGVAYVVEGSVRKQGDKVRITAQLIKAADGFHVWSDTFTRDLKDIFAVQDEIAGLVANQLSLKLGANSSAARAAVDPQAFELYVQARQAWNLRNEEGFARAEQLLNRALEVAPDFARAHAALADVWYFQTVTKGITGTFARPDPPEFTRVLAKIREALALDPGAAEAHASLGNVLFSSWKYAEAEQEYRRAIALNPNYASAHQWLAAMLTYDGRIDEALVEYRLASELDPLSSRIADNHGYTLYLAGRYTEALAMYDRAIALQPSNYQAVGFRPLLLACLGRMDEAVSLVRALPSSLSVKPSVELSVYAMAGMHRESEALLPAAQASGAVPTVYLLLLLGRLDQALTALDAGSVDTPGNYLLIDYDRLDGDPRFQKFIATIGWTEARARMKAWRAAHPPEKPEVKK